MFFSSTPQTKENTSVFDVVQKIVTRSLKTDEVVRSRLFNQLMLYCNWGLILGAEFAKLCDPDEIIFDETSKNGNFAKSGVLWVTTKNSANSLVIYYAQEQILEKISVFFGFRFVKKLLLRASPKAKGSFAMQAFAREVLKDKNLATVFVKNYAKNLAESFKNPGRLYRY